MLKRLQLVNKACPRLRYAHMHLLKLLVFVELSFSCLEAAKAENVGIFVHLLTGLDELWPFTDPYPIAVA